MLIIDCHCHAGKGDGLTGPWDTDAPLREHLARARAAGISRTIVFAAFHSDYAVANRKVAQIVAAHQNELWGFAFVHAQRDAGRIHALVAEAVTKHGFVGIKVHRNDARISREICEAARRFRLPVLYDIMGDVGGAALIASEYPDVPFIIPHLGSFSDDWSAQHAFVGLLPRYANLYTDTSGVRRFDLLIDAIRLGGPRRILFGSDGPWLHPGVELAKVRLLGLKPADQRLVLGGNALRLIGRRNPTATGIATHGQIGSVRTPRISPAPYLDASQLV